MPAPHSPDRGNWEAKNPAHSETKIVLAGQPVRTELSRMSFLLNLKVRPAFRLQSREEAAIA
jgi:hypothetical protein